MRVLDADDEAAAVECMAASFVAEPMQRWIIGDSTVDDATRLAVHRYFVRFAWLQAMHYGGLVLGFSDSGAYGALVATVILHPPGTAIEPGSCGENCMAMRLICCKLGCALPPTENKIKFGRYPSLRLQALTKAQQALAALTKPLNGRYWKLEVVAVDPRQQGAGVGTAVTRAACAVADAVQAAPLFVECAGARLPAFYRARGFGAGAGAVIEAEAAAKKGDPGGGLRVTGMLRQPAGGGDGGAAGFVVVR